MPIDRNLLTKAAKVYEAAEAVEGMKPKEVYESHKKCTPGEFGMHKEGELGTLPTPKFDMAKGVASANTGTIGGGLAGLLGGGLYGAYNPGSYGDLDAHGKPTLKRRSRLMGALRGAAGYGLGGAALGRLGGALHGTLSQYKALQEDLKPPAVRDGQVARAIRDSETGKVIRVETDDAPAREKQNSDIGSALMHIPYDAAVVGGLGSLVGAAGAQPKAADPRLPMADEGPNHAQLRSGMKKKGEFDDLASMASGTSPRFSPTVGQGALTGAGLGALIGALRAPKGKMLKYTLGGAGIGGLTGAGSTAAYNLHDSMNFPQPYNSLTRLPATLGAGALAAHLGNKMYDEVEGHIPEKKEKKDSKKDKKETEKKSAFAFGTRVKQSLEMPTLSSLGNVGVGGLAGAGLGGLYGLMNPGEEEDENGRMRQRSRFGAALRGALGGGVLGAGGGALASYLAGRFGQSQSPTMPANMTPMPGGKLRYAPPVKSLDQIATERARHMNMKSQVPAEGPDLVFPGTPEAGAMEQ